MKANKKTTAKKPARTLWVNRFEPESLSRDLSKWWRWAIIAASTAMVVHNCPLCTTDTSEEGEDEEERSERH